MDDVIGGRFRLLGVIARGNVGEVYRAEDLAGHDGGRLVAVKLLRQARSGGQLAMSSDHAAVARFEREIRIMRMLHHRNIPRILDGGVDASGFPYLAMELLDGRPLSDLVSQHPQLPVSWVAAFGMQIADGLSAAHNAGIVHRDLKPSNVMVLPGGLAKVLDFGMGRIVDDAGDGQVTSTGMTVGTARYMAPEQFTDSRVLQAADLYSLGCVLYTLLIGVPPFDGGTAYELGQRHINEEPVPLQLQRPDIPPEMARLVERLLKKRPEERPADAYAVRAALAPFVNGTASVAGWDTFNPISATASPRPTVPQPAMKPQNSVGMDVFAVHRRLIADYSAFTQGGTVIRDERISDYVDADLAAKSQWPDPWLSLNPSFETSGTVTDLARDGVLHDECGRIFQSGKDMASTVCNGVPLTLYRHQRDAIDTASSGESYVLTTGTGSGKSLAYIVPIVDRVLRTRGPQNQKRVRAIVVYPMNALANSQLGELDKYLLAGYGSGHEPVTYARYTGQENPDDRKKIRDNPPDILLTNYVMLELMLTRPDERRSLIKMARGLEFLVFDELHTYRGRQGADVSLLIRRVREACAVHQLQCIGTSATMSNEGTVDDQRDVVAGVASTIFGAEIRAANVIGETLLRTTDPAPASVSLDRLRSAPPPGYTELVADPLARWIESRFGVATAADGSLVRQRPTRIEDPAAELAEQSGESPERCAAAIQETLQAGAQARHPVTNRPLFAFRLHQFLSKGDTVHVTLEPNDVRQITRNYQRVMPGTDGKVLMPLAFCRDCGQEYHTVWRTISDKGVEYEPRRDTIATGGRAGDGYLYLDPDSPWPRTVEEAIANRRLPESWLDEDEHGQQVVRDSYQKRLPIAVQVDAYGREDPDGLAAAFIPAPFMFCPHCMVSYEQTRGKDFAKLATLGQEGRSSATSLISASIVRSLKELPDNVLGEKARKLLTFVDNRQDASLQAGHFNDFVQVVQLRGALYRALVEAGDDGIQHEELAGRVVTALGLQPVEYTGRADQAPSLARNAARTLRDVVAFRLYLDLQRGWRITLPNLEQTGLLVVDYLDLDWVAGNDDLWADKHERLTAAAAGQRAEILRALLDEMRRGLAIDVQYFRDDFDTLLRASEERLIEPWVLSESDRPRIGTAYPQGSKPGADRSNVFLSGRNKFGKYLRREHFTHLSVDEAQQIIAELLEVLADNNLVARVNESPRRIGRFGRPHRTVITTTG